MKLRLPWRRPVKHLVSEEEIKLREQVRCAVEETNQRMLGQLYDLQASLIIQDPRWREKHQ